MTGLAPAGAGVARVGAGLACGLVLLLAAAVSATTAPDCAAPDAPSDASAAAERTIPAAYLTLYQQAGRRVRASHGRCWRRSARSSPTTAAPPPPASSPA